MIIDAHVHVGPLDQYGLMVDDFIKSLSHWPTWWDPSRNWRREDIARPTEELIKDMDKYGIDKSCLLPFVAIPRKCKVSLDWVAGEVKKYPDRLIGFVSVDPIGGLKAVRELDYGIDKLGFKGLKLSTAYNLVSLDDKRTWPVWERAEELGIPVLVHTAKATSRCPIAWQDPLLLTEVGDAFPELKLIMCHAGAVWGEHAFAMADHFPNFYVEVSFLPTLGMDYIIHIAQLIKAMGIDAGSLFEKAIYGTDYPWASNNHVNLWKKVPMMMKERGMDPCATDDDIKKLIGGNMAKLLKI